MVSKFIEERDSLFNVMIENTFFRNWRLPRKHPDKNYNLDCFEMVLTPECTNSCTYCYMKRYPGLSADNITDEILMKNLKRCLNFLVRNRFQVKLDIFTGDFFHIKCWKEFLEEILRAYENVPVEFRPHMVTIPTNMWWITDDNMVDDVDNFLSRFKHEDMPMYLSASVDGKYCEENRPSTINLVKDDVYYDRLFALSNKLNYAFHPMVYSHNIHKWIDNFDWFIKNMEKYKIPEDSLYLLEVRNAEWSDTHLKYYYRFIQHLLRYFYVTRSGSIEDMIKALTSVFNIMNNVFSTVGRGLGCSVQGELAIRLPDMKVGICHRTFYDEFILADFVPESNAFANTNPELYTTFMAFNNDKMGYCQHCAIRKSCSSICFGSSYEATGSLFEPIPTVCKLYHAKMLAIVDFFHYNNIPFSSFSLHQDGHAAALLRYIYDRYGG